MAENDIIRIKQILEEKGISVKDFADKAGVSYTYASEIVRNVKFPRPEVLKQIANSLDIDIRELFISTKEVLEAETREIFVKNEDGTFEQIGYINKNALVSLKSSDGNNPKSIYNEDWKSPDQNTVDNLVEKEQAAEEQKPKKKNREIKFNDHKKPDQNYY